MAKHTVYSNLVDDLIQTPIDSFEKMRKKLILLFACLFVLFGGLSGGLVLVGYNQDIREKAAPKLPDTGDSRVKTYKSAEHGYQVVFNPSVWQTGQDLSLDNQEIVFSLLGGSGQVKMTANLMPQDSNLDALSLQIANEINNNQLVKLTNQEKITRNSREFYKFTITEPFLDLESTYYQYLTLQNRWYYLIEARYSPIEPAPALTENLVDSMEFSKGSNKVEGASTAKRSGLDPSQISDVAKPSVVSLIYIYCNQVLVDQRKVKFLQPEYNLCGASKGTGFVVSTDGYIATNGHVVNLYPEQTFAESLLGKKISQLSVDLVREISFAQQNRQISENEARSVLSQASINPIVYNSLLQHSFRLVEDKIVSFGQQHSKYLVNLGNALLEIDWEKAEKGELLAYPPVSDAVREAELVDYDLANPYNLDSILYNKTSQGSDVAVLKIKETQGLDFPALDLVSTSLAKEGEAIVVVGFPTLVEGSKDRESAIGFASSNKPTVTRGIVSALKTDQAGNTLVQTDASIEHGNSGGPAFNTNGQVMGIATYSLSSGSGNYNFLRATDDLLEILARNNIELAKSSTAAAWKEGLENFWSKRYKSAVDSIEKARQLYPVNPVFQVYITEAEAAIKKGEGKTFLGTIFAQFSMPAALFLVLSGMAGGAVLMLVLFPIRFKTLFSRQM